MNEYCRIIYVDWGMAEMMRGAGVRKAAMNRFMCYSLGDKCNNV